MCGIAGFVDLWDASSIRSAEERAATLDRMCRIIRHRGPDDQGVMLKPGVALGMRRLAIIDLVTGHQPISGEDGSVTIVFNGEIYNFQEIKPKLEARGHTFKTHSDTEAIVHLGVRSCLFKRTKNMFAFAIWDEKAQSYLSRATEPARNLSITPLHHQEHSYLDRTQDTS